MKKLIEIDDALFKRLEKIQNDYNINSLTPVISLVLTLGVNWFKKLEGITPQIYTPPQWDFWSPYIGDTVTVTQDDKWNIITNITGHIDEPEE